MEWYISLLLCMLFSAVLVFALWQCFFAAYRRHRDKSLRRFQEQTTNRALDDIIAQCRECKASSDLS